MKIVDEKTLREKYRKLTEILISRKITITTMESCTSGQIASLITDTEGASAIFRGSYVAYSNEAKISFGVPPEIIQKYGVYSPETALAMAAACQKAWKTEIGIGVTGSFGNADPENADSIPGEVDVAIITGASKKNMHLTLPGGISRYESKMFVAGEVAEYLLSCYNNNGVTEHL